MENLYPFVYPIGGLILGICTSIIYFLRKDLRKIIKLMSVVLIPYSVIAEILFFQDYWFPPDFIEFYIGPIRIISGDIIMVITTPALFVVLYPFLTRQKFENLEKVSYKKIFRDIFIAQGVVTLIYYFIWLISDINSIFAYTLSTFILSIFFILRNIKFIKLYLFMVLLMGTATFVFYFAYQVFIGDDYLQSVWLLDHSQYAVNFLGVLIPLTEVIFGAFVAPFYFLLIFFLEPELRLVKIKK